MTDSNAGEHRRDAQTRNERRLRGIKRWVEHIQETPPEQWGPEQNAVVNAQVDAARSSELDAEHYEEIERLAREIDEG